MIRSTTGAAAAAIALLAMAGQASAQDVRVGDITAHLFLETSGRLSDDVLGRRGANLTDIPLGKGEFGEPANALVFRIPLSGAKNTQPRFAAAIVNITITGRTGQKRLEKRALEGFIFGESGTLNRAVMVENVTCSKVEIEVKTQRSTKRADVEFKCNDPAPEARPGQQGGQQPRR
jgi:hypothetical protein